MAEGGKVLALFDVDGTLTAPRKVCSLRSAPCSGSRKMAVSASPRACHGRW